MHLSGRVGTCLATGSPPRTVRAPLNAYGSTSETAERYINQRGHFLFDFELSQKCGVSPLQNQTQIVPVIIPSDLFRNNSMENDFRRPLQRQPGDGASGLLTLEKMHSSLLHVRTSSTKQGVCTPAPLPASQRLLRINSAAELQLTVPCSLLSLTRFAC